MSSIPETLPGGIVHDVPVPPPEPSVRSSGLPRAAKVYLAILGALTAGVAAKFYIAAPSIHHDWAKFVALAAAATLAHTFPVQSPRNAKYHTSVLFLVAGALLLPPELVV